MGTRTKRNIYAIDLFCGAGGLTRGLANTGIRVNLGVDIDPDCEFPYTANNNAKYLLKSVADVTGSELSPFFRKNGLRLLAGCAPCQTFSSYNRKASDHDQRWWLLSEFGRLITETEPHFVTMENVPLLLEHGVFQD
jgi:DNA (cytosine-5)-methyltransferase 1